MHARMHADDRALVEVLAAAARHGDHLPLEQVSEPTRVAAGVSKVVATLDAEHYTPEVAAAIHAAADTADRAYVRTAAVPTTGQANLAELAQRITEVPAAPRGAVIVVEDAAVADPADLAILATALGAAHGRLLLIDSGQHGPARRLLDGLALPWDEHTRPPVDIDDPDLARAAERHRYIAARYWRILTNPPTQAQELDRGLDLDLA